ncbi:hypothetical protein C2E23DRAFT_836207 [Lenzites betulinus]|nr:hypothetical protein C2E23DRAFT_836207 [Lenzites betulinus]
MADSNTIHSLTSTLASQPMSTQGSADQQHAQHPQHPQHTPNPGELQNHPGMPPMGMPPPPPPSAPVDGANPEQPVKRRPGRPKGSGKKPIDPNAPPKIKRPVGRPRKDGLPAGSVGPRRPSRPRKRPPGTFASGPQDSPPSGGFSYPTPFVADGPWATASAPALGTRARPNIYSMIDPSLEQDDWAELARNRTDRFLHALVSALMAPHPVSGAGPSIEEAFKSHLVSLAPNSKSQPSIPSLYSILKTFWLPSSPVYFSLTASASTARTPSEHRFLYWDPQPLVFNGISCNACSNPLINRGRISSGPIKVYDLGKPFFVIGCEYVCTSPMCLQATNQQGRKFASTDASILRALPAKLKDEFPALLLHGNPDLGSGPDIWNWQGMGISVSLYNMVRASLHAGLRKEAILEIIRAIQLGVTDYDFEQFKREDVEHGAPPQLPAGIPPPAIAANGSHGEDDNDEDDDENHDAQQVEGDLAEQKDKSTEEYQEAWNANSGVPDPNGAPAHMPQEQPHAGPSGAQDPAPSQQQPSASAPPPPPSQGPPHPPPNYAYAQGPYPYPYPYAYWSQPPADQSASAAGPPPSAAGSLKRTFSIVENGTPEPGMSEPMHKRVRHCCKCGSNECKGKGGRAFCNNPCQDCGKLECKGRNSKRPDRTCADAWP